jgi:dUTP pyrophosphatase
MRIEIVRLNRRAEIPTMATPGSAGYDLYSCLDSPEIICAGESRVIGTGVSMALPEGYFGMICPRSGIASKFGITVLNSPGIVDSDYRGEIKCILINFSDKDFIVEDGMRIAQLIIMKYESSSAFQEVEKYTSDTQRGTNGFGSTGL